MNKKVILGMLVVSALLCSNVLVIANTAMNTSTSNIQINGSSDEPLPESSEGADEIIMNENFSANVMPPTDWELNQTNPSETWYIDSSLPHSGPYCASVHRADSEGLQNEWLITPMLDFTPYTKKINLSFWWYTSCYVAHWKDYIDLNVSISTDNGSAWTLIWSDDNIAGNYTSWKWFYSNIIDLSEYAGESQVKIGFQYYSNVATEALSQEVSIDDIYLSAQNVTTPTFRCDAGGPYEWCWDTQQNYIPPGVRFHGAIEGQQWWKCKWFWDFGDNSTSTIPLTTVHNYDTVGVYNVSLMVIDNSTTPHHISFDHTTVRIFLMPAPEIDIQIEKLSLGIQATVENGGMYNATQVNWTIMVRWGITREKLVANGTIERLEPNSISEPMKSEYFFKFGMIRIEITATPENIPGVIKEFKAFKIGPFLLNAHET
jgi:hypothetical protein